MDKSGLKTGILGGTFDPPHLAHLRVAEEARFVLQLEEVWFCPAFDPPHRRIKPVASFEDRLKMLQEATKKHASFTVLDVERGLSPSYTVRTLRKLTKLYPEREFYLILGWDSFAEMGTWYRYQELPRYTKLVVCTRGKMDFKEVDRLFQAKSKTFWGEEALNFTRLLPVYPLDLSSTVIRQLRKEGKPIRYLLPDEVYFYIEEKGLYLP